MSQFGVTLEAELAVRGDRSGRVGPGDKAQVSGLNSREFWLLPLPTAGCLAPVGLSLLIFKIVVMTLPPFAEVRLRVK